MKVLFAPSNIASFSSALSSGLNQYEDVCARGFSVGKNKYVTYAREWTLIQYVSWKKNPMKRFLQLLYVTYKLASLIFWADVIYWQASIKGITIGDVHYKLMRILKKPVFVEWVGSELRKPAVVSLYNPYYRQVWASSDYEYNFENDEHSQEIQKSFKKVNAIPLVTPEMSLFVDRSLFPEIHIVNARIDLQQLSVSRSANNVCVILHAPSAIGAKGTKYVRLAIEKLRQKNFSFEYREITNVTREEALRKMREADIYLDQFIVGSYGMAACEAMALGKVVVSYIMKPVLELLPQECPIVNANIDDLEKKLEELVLNPRLRKSIGEKSRAYVEQYHDARSITQQMYTLFRKALSVNREKTNQAVSV